MSPQNETKILLDIQKQIGEISRETGTQTQKLDSIEQRVIYTNGTVNRHSSEIQELKDANTMRRGRSAVIGAVTGIVMTVFTSIIISIIIGWVNP